MNKLISCECGCGTQMSSTDSRGRPVKFISGHNNRGKFRTSILKKCDYCDKITRKHQCIFKKYPRTFCSSYCRAKYTANIINNTFEFKEKHRQITKKNGNKPPLHKGENHWNWKGGIGKQNRGQDHRYLQWRKDVFARDNWTCQKCHVRGGKLSAHHIKEWAKYPELRYELDNGQCLCYDCHMRHHGLNKKVA